MCDASDTSSSADDPFLLKEVDDEDAKSFASCSSQESSSSGPLRPYAVYQSKSKRSGVCPKVDATESAAPFPRSLTNHALSGILTLCESLWNSAITLTVDKRLSVAKQYIIDLVQAPIEEVPILFSVVGSSSIADASLLFDVFERRLKTGMCGAEVPFLQHEQGRPIRVLRVSKTPKTVYDLVDCVVTAARRFNTFKKKPRKRSAKNGAWVSEFYQVILSDHLAANATYLIVIDNIEHIPSRVVTCFIQLCRQLRSGMYGALTAFPLALEKEITRQPTSRVPIGLVLGVLTSTVQAVQLHWPSDVILQTVSTSAQVFSVRDAVRYASNSLLSHLNISPALDIPTSFLSTLVDDVHQFSRSLEFFRRHIQLYFVILFSLVPPLVAPLLAPVSIRVNVAPSPGDPPPLQHNVVTPPGCISIEMALPTAAETHCPTNTSEKRFSPPCSETPLHSALCAVYGKLASLSSSHQEKEQLQSKQSSLFSARLNGAKTRNASRKPRGSRSAVSADVASEPQQHATPTKFVLYFCTRWKYRYLLSLLSSCLFVEDPLVYALSGNVRLSPKKKSTFEPLHRWVMAEFRRALSHDSVAVVARRIFQFLLLPQTHWRVLVEVHNVEYCELRRRRCIGSANAAGSETLQLLSVEALHSALTQFLSLASETFSIDTFSSGHRLTQSLTTTIKEDALRALLDALVRSAMPTTVFPADHVLPAAMYHHAWKLTTGLLNPTPGESVRVTLEAAFAPSCLDLKFQQRCAANNTFLRDLHIFFGYLLQQDRKSFSTVKLSDWFAIFCALIVGTRTLVLACHERPRACLTNQEALEHIPNPPTANHTTRQQRNALGVQNNTAGDETTTKSSTKKKVAQKDPALYGNYGCLCADCLWKRFLLAIDTLVLLGFIHEPRRSKKKLNCSSVLKNHSKSQDNVSQRQASEAFPVLCDPALERYQTLLKDFCCRQSYTPGEDIGYV